MKRRWRVVLLRNKGEILGQVEAPDVASAKAAAADQFELDEIKPTGSWCRSWAEVDAAPLRAQEAERSRARSVDTQTKSAPADAVRAQRFRPTPSRLDRCRRERKVAGTKITLCFRTPLYNGERCVGRIYETRGGRIDCGDLGQERKTPPGGEPQRGSVDPERAILAEGIVSSPR